MLLSVKKFLVDNSAVTSVKPAFARAITRLNEKIAAIRSLDENRGERGSGVTGTKSQVKESLLESILKAAGAIKAYASEKNKPDLIKSVNISKSELNRIRELELVKRAESIHDLAQSNSLELADFGITAADLSLLTDLNDTFSDLISEVGSRQGQRSGKTKSLNTLFEEVRIILEQQVDGLAATLKQNNPDFYNQYISVRVITDRGGRRNNGNGENPAPPQPV
jgi:hypothetical protein